MFTTIADLSPTPGPDRRCRFVKVTGARCRFPSKPGSDLCPDHHYKKSFTRGRFKPNPPSTFNTVPLVRFAWAEDHDSILFNCNQIALALVHSTINDRQAGALNALMHTAQRSLSQKFVHERFEARERERAAQTPGPSVPSPDPTLDYVTDYVLDTDGLPLALPDQPTPESTETPGAPSLSSGAVPEDRVESADPSDPAPDFFAEFRHPPSPERRREALLYLREFYKDDPKMLAEIETYPARYPLQLKREPESEAEPEILSTLTASAENPHSLSATPDKVTEKPPTSEARTSRPRAAR